MVANGDLTQLLGLLANGAPAELAFWDRGGPPGPGYQSNQITVRDNGATMTAIFLKTRYDRSAPPYRSDEYTAPVRRLAGLDALARAAFGVSHPEEADPHIGGVTKITLTISAGGCTLEKTFYQRLPDALRALEERVREIAATCEEEGEHKGSSP